jgi:hypothetical protein
LEIAVPLAPSVRADVAGEVPIPIKLVGEAVGAGEARVEKMLR